MNLYSFALAIAAAAHWMGRVSAFLHTRRTETACQKLACWAFNLADSNAKGADHD